jgi:hypothetical protein
MPRKINCSSSDQGVWCTDKRVKRGLFGIGARMCPVAEGGSCPYQDSTPRPALPPPPQGRSGTVGPKSDSNKSEIINISV